jgi:hypothetical protein
MPLPVPNGFTASAQTGDESKDSYGWNLAETVFRCRHAVNHSATHGPVSACILPEGALGLSGIQSAVAELLRVVHEA